jgi:hypothetical protein
MSLSKADIDLLLSLVDAGIEAQIQKICASTVPAKEFSKLITPEDLKEAHRLGIDIVETHEEVEAEKQMGEA